MPMQQFAPMTKEFATFDCDAHITEPAAIWERAKEHLTKNELEALKFTDWYDAESDQHLINGNTGGHLLGFRGTRKMRPYVYYMGKYWSVAGPGIKHDVQRALNVRNLDPETALTEEQLDYLDHRGSYEPKPRLHDMDIQGIDQVMIVPTDINTYPWLQNALGARAMCKAYNEWAFEYTLENPERLYFAALLPLQDVKFAVAEVYRVAERGCRVALIRPIDAMGNYPVQPKYEPLWNAMEETGVVYGMHPFPAIGGQVPAGYSEQYSASQLIQRTIATSGVPHTFLGNLQAFMAEASVWVTLTLMSGFFERHPKLRAAVFESDTTWLSFLLDECDKAYKLHRSRRTFPALQQLPSDTFFQHCFCGFEGDETFPSGLPDFYREVCTWSSDVYHHDGADAWEALAMMRKYEVSPVDQAKMMGGNARRLYNIKEPATIIHDRVTEIERPDWWPSEEEIARARRADAGVIR
jgi:predicted TIM-barrel fold metal-dependent hydrolase